MKQQRNEVEAMTIICNIQQMQQLVYGKQFTYEQFNGNSIDELRTLQEQLIQEYNQYIKAKQVFSYIGLPATIKIYARIIENLGEEWKHNKEMAEVCKRDAEILRDAAARIDKPLHETETTTL